MAEEIDTYFDERQIDLEEAIAAIDASAVFKLPATVHAYSTHTGHPEWRVYKAIRDGFMEADGSVRPMMVTGGEMPITTREWHIALDPAVKRIKKSVMSWADVGRTLTVLGTDGKIYEWKQPQLKHVADLQRKEIDKLACARITDDGK